MLGLDNFDEWCIQVRIQLRMVFQSVLLIAPVWSKIRNVW